MLFTRLARLLVLTFALPALTEPALAASEGCLPLLPPLRAFHEGVVVRFLTHQEAGRISDRVHSTTGQIVDPRYADNLNVLLRVPDVRNLVHVVLPRGMDATIGEKLRFTLPHLAPGKACVRIPDLAIAPAIS